MSDDFCLDDLAPVRATVFKVCIHHKNEQYICLFSKTPRNWPGRPTIWMIVGQGPIALAVGAGGGCLDIFTLLYPFSSFSLSLGDGPV